MRNINTRIQFFLKEERSVNVKSLWRRRLFFFSINWMLLIKYFWKWFHRLVQAHRKSLWDFCIYVGECSITWTNRIQGGAKWAPVFVSDRVAVSFDPYNSSISSVQGSTSFLWRHRDSSRNCRVIWPLSNS